MRTDRLSPVEAIMWRVGQDVTLRMVVGAVMILDRPPTSAALVERLASAAEHAPRLTRRPDDPTFMRARPAWVDEFDFSAGNHVQSLSLASPGSIRQALELVALLEAIPFDPERSPWDVTLIDGLAGGRAVLYLRAHHVLTDGLGGIRLMGLLLDEPGWPGTAADETTSATATALEPIEPGPASNSDRRPGTVTIDFTKALRRLADGIDAARDFDVVDTAVRGVQRALDVANSVSRQVMVTGGPLSTLPPTRSMLSRFEVVSFEGARHASLALGGSRNDLLVAAAAAGLGRYHERLGQPCSELRLATPTSQGRGPEAGGNWFAPTRLEVPTAVGRPGPQFGLVVERLAQARREPALRVAANLASTIRRMPTRLLLPALRAQADSVDFAVTALPGLRGSRHVCGSQIEASYPFGPRLGCPMNITAFGNNGRLDVGIALDPAALAEPELLVECLTEAFAGFVQVAPDDANHPSDEPSPR